MKSRLATVVLISRWGSSRSVFSVAAVAADIYVNVSYEFGVVLKSPIHSSHFLVADEPGELKCIYVRENHFPPMR